MTTLDARDITIIRARRAQILLKLQLLSDAPSGRGMVEPPTLKRQKRTQKQIPAVNGKPGAQSAPPPGVNLGELDRRQGPPPKTASLWAHYMWHFTQAKGDPTRTRSLCDCAEADYEEAMGGGRRHQAPVYGPDPKTGKVVLVAGETTEMRSKRILRDYVGWSPGRASHMEGVGAEAIKKLRRVHGYDAATGERAEEVTTSVAELQHDA